MSGSWLDLLLTREPEGSVVVGRNSVVSMARCPNSKCGRSERPGKLFIMPAPGRTRSGFLARCHKCDWHDDLVALLMGLYGLGYVEAYRLATGQEPPDTAAYRAAHGKGTARHSAQGVGQSKPLPSTEALSSPARQTGPRPIDVRSFKSPPKLWQDVMGRLYLQLLDEPVSAQGRELLLQRGLNPDRRAGAGCCVWNERNRFFDAVELDLPDIGCRYVVPRGLVLFSLRGGTVVGVETRRVPEDARRWGKASYFRGVAPRPLIGFPVFGNDVVVTEAGLDALSVLEASGHSLSVIGAGSCDAAIDTDVVELINAAPKIWYWRDADDAGELSFKRWKLRFPKLQHLCLRPGQGKDATGLAKLHYEQPEDFPSVQTWLALNGVIRTA